MSEDYTPTQTELAYSDFLYRQGELNAWKQQQREKAPHILALLREHIPADRIGEIEEFLSARYGTDCLYEALRRDLTRSRLLEIVRKEHWQEIERYLDTGSFEGDLSSHDSELFHRAIRELPPRIW